MSLYTHMSDIKVNPPHEIIKPLASQNFSPAKYLHHTMKVETYYFSNS